MKNKQKIMDEVLKEGEKNIPTNFKIYLIEKLSLAIDKTEKEKNKEIKELERLMNEGVVGEKVALRQVKWIDSIIKRTKEEVTASFRRMINDRIKELEKISLKSEDIEEQRIIAECISELKELRSNLNGQEERSFSKLLNEVEDSPDKSKLEEK